MRNRIYITSVTKDNFNDEQSIISASNNAPYKNVLLFSPDYHGLFLNGKRYGSMNEIKNDESVSSVFELKICTEDNINSIALAQKQLLQEFNVSTIIVSAAYMRQYVTGEYNTYEIYLNVGERAQVFLAYRTDWEWRYVNDTEQNFSENPFVVIDANNIIHGVCPCAGGQIIYLCNKTSGDKILAVFKVYVFDSNNNMFDTIVSTELANSILSETPHGFYGKILDIDNYTRIINEMAVEQATVETMNTQMVGKAN